MVKLTKRMRIINNSLSSSKEYEICDAISLLKELSTVHFVESLDVSISLGIDARKSEQNVRGNVFLPHGIGRHVRVVVFTQGVNVELAKSAGADLVGLDDLMGDIQNIKKKYDVVVATPDVMYKVGQLGSILGPCGLMPNPKFGTVVAQDISAVVKKIKVGQIRYRNDKYGIIHASLGRVVFDSRWLKENLESLILDLKRNRPSQVKGVYIKKIGLSTTMGGSVLISQSSLF